MNSTRCEAVANCLKNRMGLCNKLNGFGMLCFASLRPPFQMMYRVQVRLGICLLVFCLFVVCCCKYAFMHINVQCKTKQAKSRQDKVTVSSYIDQYVVIIILWNSPIGLWQNFNFHFAARKERKIERRFPCNLVCSNEFGSIWAWGLEPISKYVVRVWIESENEHRSVLRCRSFALSVHLSLSWNRAGKSSLEFNMTTITWLNCSYKSKTCRRITAWTTIITVNRINDRRFIWHSPCRFLIHGTTTSMTFQANFQAHNNNQHTN